MNAISRDFRSVAPVEVQLKVSRYDQVASLLVSLLIIVSVSVALMFIIWLTQTLKFPSGRTILIQKKPASPSSAAGFNLDLALPGMEELPELTEPQLAVELQAVTSAVSTLAAVTDALEPTSRPPGQGNRDGDEDGKSDLDAEDQDSDEDIIPRWERWQIRWTSSSLAAYSRQLDFFKVELAAVGGTQMIDYATNFSSPRPQHRTGPGKLEERLYMTWQSGALAASDRTLLATAGISTTNRLVLQFYPQEVEDRLARLELEHATSKGHADAKEFRKTFFGVRRQGKGYEIFVEGQQFRVAPR